MSAVRCDQVAARHIGQDTPLPSLELCGEPGGYSSVSYPHAAPAGCRWKSNPRKVFYSMFGQGDSNEERDAIMQLHREPARLRTAGDR